MLIESEKIVIADQLSVTSSLGATTLTSAHTARVSTTLLYVEHLLLKLLLCLLNLHLGLLSSWLLTNVKSLALPIELSRIIIVHIFTYRLSWLSFVVETVFIIGSIFGAAHIIWVALVVVLSSHVIRIATIVRHERPIPIERWSVISRSALVVLVASSASTLLISVPSTSTYSKAICISTKLISTMWVLSSHLRWLLLILSPLEVIDVGFAGFSFKKVIIQLD